VHAGNLISRGDREALASWTLLIVADTEEFLPPLILKCNWFSSACHPRGASRISTVETEEIENVTFT
jgi:hypothetical protein